MLRDFLIKNRKSIEEASASFLKADDLIRLAIQAAGRNPKLAECSPRTVLRALMDASQLRIVPGGAMGQGYLIPRRNRKTGEMECCFDPGYRALLSIATRNENLASFSAHAVFENDMFEVRYGTEESIKHEPCHSGRGKVVAAYAVAKFKTGLTQIEVLFQDDLDKIRKMSMAQGADSPWALWPEEMARKSVVRRIVKYLPYNPPDTEKIIEVADRADGVIDSVSETVPDLPEAEQQPIVALPDPDRNVPITLIDPDTGEVLVSSTAATEDNKETQS